MITRESVPLDVLHIIPRFVGGGPERSILASVATERRTANANRHVVAVLDPPVSPHMFLAARRLRVELKIRPERMALAKLIADSDLLQLHFWNHPCLTSLLRDLTFPPARVMLWSHVLGIRAPQILTEDIGRFADYLILTTELSQESAGARHAREHGIPVACIPGLSDMGGLEDFTRRGRRGGICVGYIGVVNYAKMHPRFAEMSAAVEVPDVRFVVCGGGGGEDELRRRFAAFGCADRVEVRGPVQNIREALEEFDIFGYPLAEDTYATSEKVLQEAMWVGIPPVVFPHGGVGRLVEHNQTGLVAHAEAEYSRAIEQLARDAALRQRLGEGARRYARAEFDPARWCRVANEIMRALMAKPRRCRSPLQGTEDSAAQNFVRSLGDQAAPFAVSFAGPAEYSLAGVAVAEREIAEVSTVVARGEGGVAHYRNSFIDDPHLRLWAGLISVSAGDRDVAIREFAAADALGLGGRGAAARERFFGPS
jgi:glycosyltransferase involved in cell wall biosynthesis